MTTLSAAAVRLCFSVARTGTGVIAKALLLAMRKSNAPHLLWAMRNAWLMDPIGESKQHCSSALILGLDHSFRTASPLLSRADAAVAPIAAALGHTVDASIPGGGEVMGLTHRPGTHALRLATPVGRPISAHPRATGQSLLARRMPDETVCALIREPLQQDARTALQSVADPLVRLRAARVAGDAKWHGEANRGVGIITSSAGLAETGEAVSVCIAHPVATVTTGERTAIIARLLAAARDLTALVVDAAWMSRGERLAPAA